MPARVTTRRAIRTSLLLTFLLIFTAALASPGVLAQTQSPLPAVPPPPPGLNPQQNTQSSHTIKASVAMVVLHATVVDEKGQFVPGLTASDFHVSEDKVPQQISVFSRDDIPVTMGLVIDNSASMREKRAQVNAAAMTFVKTSNPQDEDFVVNFNDESYLDINEDFTNDTQELNEALSRIDTRGMTALYDAIVSSLDHLKKGHKDKRVLLVITDGEDDASRLTFEETIKAAEQSSAAIYAIGVFSQEDRKTDKKSVRHSKKTLTELAEATGGLAFFPDTLDQVGPICVQVARDIRNQYTIGYYPTNTTQDGTFRSVRLQASGHRGMGKLSVRTRAGYYAPKAAKQ